MSGTSAAPKEVLTRYDRIRKEIVAYDDIAQLNLDQDIEPLAERRIGRELLARFRLKSPVEGFPNPPSLWLDSRSNPMSLLQAYRWLCPIEGVGFLQLGGSGTHAIRALMAGADRAWLATPMAQEGALCRRIDEYVHGSARVHVIQGIGEQLPFADASIDRIFGGGTLHHLELGQGLGEIARVLKPGGRAAFVDPNLNFIYKLLERTRIRDLAREPGAQCYPLRVADIYANATGFTTVKCPLAGGLLRYAIVGVTRILKLEVPLSMSLALQSVETMTLLKLRLRALLGGLAVLLER